VTGAEWIQVGSSAAQSGATIILVRVTWHYAKLTERIAHAAQTQAQASRDTLAHVAGAELLRRNQARAIAIDAANRFARVLDRLPAELKDILPRTPFEAWDERDLSEFVSKAGESYSLDVLLAKKIVADLQKVASMVESAKWVGPGALEQFRVCRSRVRAALGTFVSDAVREN